MIRINLIERARNRRPSRSSGLSLDWAQAGTTSPALRVGLGLIALGGLWLAGHYLYLQHQATDLQQRMVRARIENQHLQTVQRAYNLGLQRRQELQHRLQIIGSLRNARSGPIALMVAVGDAVNQSPDLWLTALAEQPQGVDLKGNAVSLNGIANLMNQMQSSGYFQQVELKDSNQRIGEHERNTFQFELLARPATPRP